MKTIILGAGITGIGAGIATGGDVYERANVPGGLCRTITSDGFQFEFGGGHWIFGDVSPIKKIYTKPFLQAQRKAGVYINEMYPYPIQNYEIEKDFPQKNTLKAWLYRQFGPDLCRMFFFPFNYNYTDGLYSYVVQDDTSKSPKPGELGYNANFVYPEDNLNDFIYTLSKGLNIYCNKEAVKICPKNKIVTFSDESVVYYDKLISTLPLVSTLNMTGFDATSLLPFTSVVVVNIGAERGPKCPKEHWVYFPRSKSGFFRVGFYSNVLKHSAPEGCVSIYVEKSYFNREETHVDTYADSVINELTDMGYIRAVKTKNVNFIKHAYTWLYDREARVSCLKTLQKMGIKSVGRYGSWKFQGIVESFKEGLGV